MRLIVITDGDVAAVQAAERIAGELGLDCISRSGGRPTPLAAHDIVDLARTAPRDPVLVLVDDDGRSDRHRGERVLQELLEHPEAEVLGVVAVASDTPHVRGVRVDASVTGKGSLIRGPVDKEGGPLPGGTLKGDTVDALRHWDGLVVGIGDVGKMEGRDDPDRGCPVTARAITEILRRHGYEFAGGRDCR